MKMLIKLIKFLGLLLIGFMFAVCMVIGVVPILPKRKEQFEIEIKMEQTEKEKKHTVSFTQAERNS